MRIRAPEEFADGSVQNNFRPTSVDVGAATSLVREARTSLREIGQIVDTAHDNAMRSQALADSVEYETRLTALRAEMDNEPPPDGTDEADWARTYPQRWMQRSTTIRDDVSRRRGRRSNAYLRYFDERANQITGREQQSAIERGQAQIVDQDRAAGVEILATYAAQATNPDLAENPPEGSDPQNPPPSRSGYEQQYINYAREMARRGTWSYQFAAERITQLQSERRTFLETEGRFQRAREAADRVRDQFPDDVDQQIEALSEIENAREREQAINFAMSDSSRDQAARQAEVLGARSRVEVLINRHGASWQRYAQPEDIARIQADPGGMAQIDAQLDALLDPTGSTAATRGVNSARLRVLLEDFGNAPNFVDPDTGEAIGVGQLFMGMNLDAPLSARDVDALNRAGLMAVQEGDVLSSVLTREDYSAISDLQRQRRSGVAPNGDLVVSREVNDIVAYVTANGLADFGSEDDSSTRRAWQAQFRAFVGQIVRSEFSGNGGARDLSEREIANIARQALSRTGNNGRGTDSTPLYRRRTSNRVPYQEIPRGIQMRLEASIRNNPNYVGMTDAEIQDQVVRAWARENSEIARSQ